MVAIDLKTSVALRALGAGPGSAAAAHCVDAMPAGRPIPRDPDAALFTCELAYLFGCSPRKLEQLRVKGGGPPFVKDGRSTRYIRGLAMEWRAQHLRRSTSDAGEAA